MACQVLSERIYIIIKLFGECKSKYYILTHNLKLLTSSFFSTPILRERIIVHVCWNACLNIGEVWFIHQCNHTSEGWLQSSTPMNDHFIHRRFVTLSEWSYIGAPMFDCQCEHRWSLRSDVWSLHTSEVCFFIRVIIHRSSDVWLPMYAQMVAEVGVFQVVEVPTNWYEYLIPNFTASKTFPSVLAPL